MRRDELVSYLDDLLRISEIEDDSLNGLQVEGKVDVNRVALAVDASVVAFRRAKDQEADFLIVHHGLFWGLQFPLVGLHYLRIKELIEADLSLYAAHLPLDIHPELGNNARIADLLSLSPVGMFGEYHGSLIGVVAEFNEPIPREEFVALVEKKLRENPLLLPFGSLKVKRVGIVSGRAPQLMEDAIKAGCDLFLSGEPSHAHYHLAEELSLNCVFAGHYATEKWGVLALGERIRKRFSVDCFFIDLPTGL
jgi:dinuclear metal center YbgI/SA1388 family protein